MSDNKSHLAVEPGGGQPRASRGWTPRTTTLLVSSKDDGMRRVHVTEVLPGHFRWTDDRGDAGVGLKPMWRRMVTESRPTRAQLQALFDDFGVESMEELARELDLDLEDAP